MRKINKRITPAKVASLSECEVFVFGSNLQGQHGGGAARVAHERFGAKWGVGVGPTGQCYAIPTMHGGLDDIRPYVNQFIEYAKKHPNNRFLLTRVGCGIAGFKDNDMARLFEAVQDLPNVSIPKEWIGTICLEATLGLRQPRRPEPAPKALDEAVLTELCRKHSYEIGAGIKSYLPNIRIRYVIDRNKFGYAHFGDFFFDKLGNLFVWHTDDGWMARHNQETAHEVFEDECYGRGYAVEHIFAGVRTTYQDANSEWIYTGDVLRICSDPEHPLPVQDILALSNLGQRYSFPLDNHDLTLQDAATRNKVERIGTVFYQLESELGLPSTVRERAMQFNGWRDTDEERLEKALMARYTPNFDQERWKYSVLDILGCEEFNWRE